MQICWRSVTIHHLRTLNERAPESFQLHMFTRLPCRYISTSKVLTCFYYWFWKNTKICNVGIASTGKVLVPCFAEISHLAQKLRGHTSAHICIHTHTCMHPSDITSLFPSAQNGNGPKTGGIFMVRLCLRNTQSFIYFHRWSKPELH